MSATYDVLVVGGGLAGAAAALEAACAGARVALVAKAPGSSAVSSGCWDLAGNPRWRASRPLEEALDLRANLAALREDPHHLLHRVPTPESSLAALAERLRLPMATGGMLALLTDRGRLKFTARAQSSLARGNLAGMKDARLLLVGLEGFFDFHAETAAQSIRGFIEGSLRGRVASVDCDYVTLPGSDAPYGLSAFALARRFDDPEMLEWLIDAVKVLARRRKPTHLALPAVLGAADGEPALRAIEEAVGLPAFELVPHAPSVPGLRLHRAIEAALEAAGVARIVGEAVGAEASGARVSALRARSDGGETAHGAKAFVLAGGKFLGGGIRKSRAFSEPVFGLPVFYRGRRLDAIHSGKLLGANPGARQPLFSVGLRADDALRPLDEDGAPAYENLFAAGWILGGYDFLRDGAGLGLAAATGTLAGRSAKAAA